VFVAARSLRQGELTMMTLIATGILVSYGTRRRSRWAAGRAVLRCRGDADRLQPARPLLEMRKPLRHRPAVEALLELAPPTARRVQDGQEEEVPLEAIAVGDVPCRSPGRTPSRLTVP